MNPEMSMELNTIFQFVMTGRRECSENKEMDTWVKATMF
jgi:hypothetical protein